MQEGHCFSAKADRGWTKENKTGLFDVTMGSNHGAEICGCTFVLATLPTETDAKRHHLVPGSRARGQSKSYTGGEAERIRPSQALQFSDLGL